MKKSKDGKSLPKGTPQGLRKDGEKEKQNKSTQNKPTFKVQEVLCKSSCIYPRPILITSDSIDLRESENTLVQKSKQAIGGDIEPDATFIYLDDTNKAAKMIFTDEGLIYDSMLVHDTKKLNEAINGGTVKDEDTYNYNVAETVSELVYLERNKIK